MKIFFGTSIFFTAIGLLFFTVGFAQNGIYLQHRYYKNKTVFIPDGSKVKVKIKNGASLSGKLEEADSLGMTIKRTNGKPVRIDFYSAEKIKVFNPHDYLKFTKSLGGNGGCGFYNCDVYTLLVVALAYSVIVVGESVIDVITDISNDVTYDVKNVWLINGQGNGGGG